jgi:probable rRNA maturation factor
MTIQFIMETKPDFSFHYKALSRQLGPVVLEQECFPYQAEVTISIVDDERIRELNLQMRGIDRATDVLSFPMIDYPGEADYSLLRRSLTDYYNPDSGEVMLGDIVISADHVRKQAEEYGHSEKREYAFLLTHSMLHLLGYDHETDPEREKMEEKQRQILNALKIYR